MIKYLAASLVAAVLVMVITGVLAFRAITNDSISGEQACQAMADRPANDGDSSDWTEVDYRNIRGTFERVSDADVRDAGVALVDVIWAAQEAGDDKALAYLTPIITTSAQLTAACSRHGVTLKLDGA